MAEHVEPRYTKDLDLWIDNSTENARLAIDALAEFGAPLQDITESDLMNPTTVYQIGLPPSRIDSMTRSFPNAGNGERLYKWVI